MIAGILAVTLAACARTPVAAPADPPIDLRGFRVGPVSVLTLENVASDALDPSGLTDLLEAHGFTGASRRAYSAGIDQPIRTVRVEVVGFDGVSGARAYLDWLHEHAVELVGDVREEPRLDPPGAFVVSHAPSACCSKEQHIWLAAWQKGSRVVWMLMMGPEIRRDRVGELVTRVDASL